MFKKITIGAALAASAMTVAPSAALANHDGYYGRGYEQSYRGDRYDRRDRYYQGRNQYYGQNQYRRCKGTTGTIVGGAAGALLGRELTRNRQRGRSGTTGTVLGAAAGALLGREVAKSACRN